MANFNKQRLKCLTVVADNKTSRMFSYDGATATVVQSTDVLAIADVKALTTWSTATNSTLRKGDFISFQCTDGVIDTNVVSVVALTGVPTMSWITLTPAA
jgi:hypothetical protein